VKNKSSNFSHRMALAAINLWEAPWGAAILAGLVYLLVSVYPSGRLLTQSFQPFYNYLADAFLHGQTWLRIIPPYMDDLVFINGRFYLYWAPFPAIVLMPFVAIFGVKLNDVLFTVLVAAFNVGLVAQLLRAACQAEFLNLTKSRRAILVFFFAFGTVHFMLAQYGRVWYTGQIIGFTCTLLAYWAAFSLSGSKAWFFTGLALAGAMLSRSQMVFTGIFPAVYLLFREKQWDLWRVIRNLAWAALPLSVALLFYLFYNQARFGHPMNVGLAYIPYSGVYLTAFQRYGFFNIHYVPINLYYHFIFYPFPLRPESTQGGSLFLLSSLFFGLFAAFWKPRKKIYVWALLASILLTYFPIVLIMGTGFAQFGPRYTLDFTVPMLLLTGLGIEKWKPIVPLVLAIISTIQYFIGVKVLG
jgi:hypothetical protein